MEFVRRDHSGFAADFSDELPDFAQINLCVDRIVIVMCYHALKVDVFIRYLLKIVLLCCVPNICWYSLPIFSHETQDHHFYN